MPIKPFEFTNADVLINQKKEQLDAMRASGDPQQQQLANSQALVDALFGDPAIQKARATDKALAEGMALTQDEGEGNIDFQIRQQKAIMSGVAASDPRVAVQANQNVLELQQEQREQQLLKAKTDRDIAIETADEARKERQQGRLDRQETRADRTSYLDLNEESRKQIEWEELQAIAKSAKQTWVFATDKDLNTYPLKVLSDGPPDETAVSALNAMKAENPELELEMVSGADFMERQGILGGGTVGLSDGAKQKKLDGLKSAGSTYRDFGNLFGTISKDLGALGMGAELMSDLSAANVTAERLQFNLYDVQDLTDEEMARYLEEDSAMFERVIADGGFGNTSAIARAQMKGLAYKVAKMLDPGGRLSDQDVEMAMRMISGDGDAGVLHELMMERIQGAHRDQASDIEMIKAGHVYGKFGKKQLIRYQEDLARAQEAGAALWEAIQVNKEKRIKLQEEKKRRAAVEAEKDKYFGKTKEELPPGAVEARETKDEHHILPNFS